MLQDTVHMCAVGDHNAGFIHLQPTLAGILSNLPQCRTALVVICDTEKSCSVVGENGRLVMFDSHAHGHSGGAVVVGDAQIIVSALLQMRYIRNYAMVQLIEKNSL